MCWCASISEQAGIKLAYLTSSRNVLKVSAPVQLVFSTVILYKFVLASLIFSSPKYVLFMPYLHRMLQTVPQGQGSVS